MRTAEPRPDRMGARLPAVYARGGQSNTGRLLGLVRDALDRAAADTADVGEAAGLAGSFGYTLDLFGEMTGQPRGALDDTRYRYLIRNRVARNFVAGDQPGILDAVAVMFDTDKSRIQLADAEAPCTALLAGLPYEALALAGLSAPEAVRLIKQLLPVGVRLEAANFEGSFAFSAVADEWDAGAGFSDHPEPEKQTMGGWLGLMAGGGERRWPIRC